jgi:alpha-beta hydrolase superfamily lysophospholipase
MSVAIDLLIISVLFMFNATLVILVAGPLILLKPTRRKPAWYARFTQILEPRDAGLPQEKLSIETFDGLKLQCWFVSSPAHTKGTLLFLHGVGDCKIAGIPFARAMYTKGYNVFLYDSRQHGESEGDYCTYGFYEKFDCTAALTYLTSRTDVTIGPIGVYGTSMGAAVAIQAAANDKRIAAVVAEGSFTSLKTIFVDYQKRIIKLPWHFLRNVALVQSQRIANFKARLVSPIEDIRRLQIPVLIVHGEHDTFIKPEYSGKLFDAARPPKELLEVKGADHNSVWEAGGKPYEERISAFFEAAFRLK